MALSDKKMSQVTKALGKETLKDLEALSADELKSQIAQAQESVKQAVEGLEANNKYQNLKDDLAIFNQGLSEVKKRQNAITQYSLHLLEEKGK